MAKGIVCDSCENFEKGEGYSIRIYKNTTKKGKNGFNEPRCFRILTFDDVCTECVDKVADVLGVSHEEIEAKVKEWQTQ